MSPRVPDSRPPSEAGAGRREDTPGAFWIAGTAGMVAVCETGGATTSSKPAAMTVTRISSPRESSMTLPKMMFASGCAASRTSCEES